MSDELTRLRARLEELEDADLLLGQLQADNLEIRAERDALRERVRELGKALAAETEACAKAAEDARDYFDGESDAAATAGERLMFMIRAEGAALAAAEIRKRAAK